MTGFYRKSVYIYCQLKNEQMYIDKFNLLSIIFFLQNILRAYLSKESCEGSYVSDMGHNKLAISDSGHLESKACVNKASGPESAIKAFRLLRESAAVQVLRLNVTHFFIGRVRLLKVLFDKYKMNMLIRNLKVV